MSWKKVMIIAVAAVGVSLIAMACSDDDDDLSQADLEAQLCADLATLDTADGAFDDLSAESTIADVEAANDAFNAALDDVDQSASDLADVRVQPLDDAYAALDQAISDVTSDMTIQEALESIQDELDAVGAAWQNLFSSAGCE